MDLRDETIVVTGGASGIGAAMANAFVTEGANVVACDIDQQRLSQFVSDGGDTAGEITGIAADVRRWDDVHNLVRDTREMFGSIDVFVNNAALRQFTIDGNEPKLVDEIDLDEWDAILDTNLRGVFLSTKAVIPVMRSQGDGTLLYVSSILGQKGRERRTPYTASKFGLEGFCESLTLELTGTGIDVVRFRPPSGGDLRGVFTENFREHGYSEEAFAYQPNVVSKTVVRLAAGEGEHGGRYAVTEDGDDYVLDPLSNSESPR